MFSKKKPGLINAATDHLASAIAAQIIKRQIRFASALNAWINRYSKRRQKWLLGICCGAFACGLIVNLWLSTRQLTHSMPVQNFRPGHIGIPSEQPGKPKDFKSTDSSTTKK